MSSAGATDASLSLNQQWRRSGYWRRTLSYFLVGEQGWVTITLIDPKRVVGDWTGQVLDMTDDGPIGNWKGHRVLLCTWDQMRAIETVSRRDRMLGRLMQAFWRYRL